MNKQLWKAHLSLARAVADHQDEIEFVCFQLDAPYAVSINHCSVSDGVVISFDAALQIPSSYPLIFVQSKLQLITLRPSWLELPTQKILENYLPYCLLPIYARRQQRTIAVAHFAQSLDGRIATVSGDSRWIGNKENLEHAHRMRALCNAILVGNNTLKYDKPKLTVRKVEGRNPIRVVIGSHLDELESLIRSSPDPIILLSGHKLKSNGQVKCFFLQTQAGKIPCTSVLQTLYKNGIYSVYIEGGAITTSNFIEDGAVDILQLHFSPLLFGSGKTGIVLREIQQVQKAVQFDYFYFQKIGDTMMFVGQIADAS